LSKENVLQMFFDFLNDIDLFLFKGTHSVANDHSKFLSDNKNVAAIAFFLHEWCWYALYSNSKSYLIDTLFDMFTDISSSSFKRNRINHSEITDVTC